MAITARAEGTWVTIQADTAIAIPAGSTTGDRMYLLASWKDFSITATVSDWTEVTEFADGAVGLGNGTGSMKVGVWWKEHSGSESNPTLDFSSDPSGNNVASAVIITFQKGASETWDDVRFVTAAMTNWTTTSQTVTASTSPRIRTGDLIIGLIGIRDDSATMTRPTTGIAAGAITFTGNYVEYPAAHVSTTTGFDMSADAGYRITSSSGTAAPTMTGTISAAETGAALWLLQGVSTPGFGQAQAKIKAIGVNNHGQAQADIKATSRVHAQAQALIVRKQAFGQAQARIGTPYVFVRDDYGRTLSNDLGSPDVGPPYFLQDATIWSVGSGFGRATLNDTTPENATIDEGLPEVVDAKVKARFRFDLLPPGGFHQFALYMRRQRDDAGTQIRAFSRVSQTGVLQTRVHQEINDSGVFLGDDWDNTGVTLAANEWFWLKAEAINDGSGNVDIRIKAWKDGTFEPQDWITYEITGDPELLVGGSTGVWVQASTVTSTFPLLVDFDNLLYTDDDGLEAHETYFKSGQAQAKITVPVGPVEPFVKEVGTYTTGTSTTTHVITISAAPSVGNFLIIETVIGGGRNLNSVTDDAAGGSNTYQVDRNQQNTTNHSIAIASAKITNALTTSNTITLTFSATNVVGAIVNEYTGLDPTAWFDTSNSSAQISQTPVESGVTPTTAQADELLVGNVGHAATTGFTPDVVSPVWRTRGTIASSTTVRTVRTFDRVVSSTGTYEMAGDMSSAAVNTGMIATYKLVAGAGTTVYVHGQSQAQIKNTYFGLGQSQADIKAVGFGLGQAQADIKQTYTDKTGQAQAQIKNTYFGLGQAQARIKNTYFGLGQAQADIKATSFGLGQAQADIKAIGRGFGQAQAQIKNTYFGLGQAQADIKATRFILGQAQADIKAVGFGLGQAQADIKATRFILGQAQADIKQTYFGLGQAQALIAKTSFVHGQAQADIKATRFILGQAQADIKAVSYGLGQANAWIARLWTFDNFNRTVSDTWGTSSDGYFGWGHSTGLEGSMDVNGTEATQDGNTNIRHFNFPVLKKGIVQFDFFIGPDIDLVPDIVINSYNDAFNIHTFSGPDTIQTYNYFGDVLNTPANLNTWYTFKVIFSNIDGAPTHWKVWERGTQEPNWMKDSEADDATNTFGGIPCLLIGNDSQVAKIDNFTLWTTEQPVELWRFGQAKADIKATINKHGQAQAYIKTANFALGQAQATIKQTYNQHAQAQGAISRTSFVTGQAQALIYISQVSHPDSDISVTGWVRVVI